MRKWHETERRRAAVRDAKAESAPSIVGISKIPRGERGARERGRRGGGGASCTKKYGFDHCRLEVSGPSNGRHKLA